MGLGAENVRTRKRGWGRVAVARGPGGGLGIDRSDHGSDFVSLPPHLDSCVKGVADDVVEVSESEEEKHVDHHEDGQVPRHYLIDAWMYILYKLMHTHVTYGEKDTQRDEKGEGAIEMHIIRRKGADLFRAQHVIS